MQVTGGNKSTNPFGFRWERGGADEECNLKAATGSLIKSVEPQ